jgi:hypothetical protein
LTIEPMPEPGYRRPANGQRALAISPRAERPFDAVPRSKASTVTRRDTRPVAPRRAARDPYRPAHRPLEDTGDLGAQCRVHEPPSWLLSGTLMALGVISLLATSVWLAYHYAQMWLR